jgi:(R,R)-butanediol dehydrogenase/meso-butanediol dehydrogenase/diacetyl reductase
MRAAVYHRAGELAIEERPVPDLGPTDVLVEVSHCGVCGSDLHTVLEGWGVPNSIPGHEWSGSIAAVGAGVTAWSPGDRVIGIAPPGCGACAYCRTGRPNLCERQDTPGMTESHGAFAGYIRSEERELLRVPDSVSLREAALAEPLAVALHAITRSRIEPGESALIFGAGPIGALILAALVARGIEDVSVVEPGDRRAELAAELGAEQVLNPADLDVPSMAEPGRIVDDAVDVVFEASGKRAAMEAGLGQLRKTGRLVIVGAGIDPPSFDPNRILLNELQITGAFCYDASGFVDALALLGAGELPTALLIEPVDVPLDGLLDVMHLLAGGHLAGKAMVNPSIDGARNG